jgi:hypothetical protein
VLFTFVSEIICLSSTHPVCPAVRLHFPLVISHPNLISAIQFLCRCASFAYCLHSKLKASLRRRCVLVGLRAATAFLVTLGFFSNTASGISCKLKFRRFESDSPLMRSWS